MPASEKAPKKRGRPRKQPKDDPGPDDDEEQPRRYLCQLKPPASGVEIITIDAGTLVHCSVHHLKTCIKPLRPDIIKWVRAFSWGDWFEGYGISRGFVRDNQFFVDGPYLREILRVPKDAQELIPIPREERNLCRDYKQGENPIFWTWEMAQFECRQFDEPEDRYPLLPIGRFV